MFSLCEVSGYLWNSIFYVGKDAIETNEHKELAKNLGKSGAVVPKLMSDLFDKGYHSYIDNWYTSVITKFFKRSGYSCLWNSYGKQNQGP